jgi:hypothetical protein
MLGALVLIDKLSLTHVDGSARPQTVEREINPLYYRLIDEFGKITGLPERRPIVEIHSAENFRILIQRFSELNYSCSNLDENQVLALPK